MSDDRLGMTGLLNGGRFANDNRFDMHLCSARKELVRGAHCDRDRTSDASRNRRRASADNGVVDSNSSLFGDLDWGAKTMLLRPVKVCKVNVCTVNFCKAKGIMFSGPSAKKCLFRSRSHAS